MKKLDFMESLNYLRDETIAEADKARDRKAPRKRNSWMKYAALAACAVLVIFAGVQLGRNSDIIIGRRDPVATEPNVTDITSKTDHDPIPDSIPHYSSDFTDKLGEYHNLGIYDGDYIEANPQTNGPDETLVQLLSERDQNEKIDSFYKILITEVLDASEAKNLAGYSASLGDNRATFYRGVIVYDYFAEEERSADIIFRMPGTKMSQIIGQPPFSAGDAIAVVTLKKTAASDITRLFKSYAFMYEIVTVDGLDYALTRGQEVPEVDGELEDYLSGGVFNRTTTTTGNDAVYYGAHKPYDLALAIKAALEDNIVGLINPLKPGFLMQTADEMPEALAHTGGDFNMDFYATTDLRLGYIPMELMSLAGTENAEAWLNEHTSSGGVYTAVDEAANLYSFMLYFDIPEETVREYLIRTRGIGDPIDDCSDEDIDLLMSATPEEIAEHFASPYAIRKGKNLYSLCWIYLHSAADYRAAGITREEIREKMPLFDEFGMTEIARAALNYKLQAYIDGSVTALANPGYAVGGDDEMPIEGSAYWAVGRYEPIYGDLPFNQNSATGGASSYEVVMSVDRQNLRLVEYEIVKVYTPEEAYEKTGKEYYLHTTTLYRARVLYDYIQDKEVDYYIDISEFGNKENQAKGFPEYEIGKRLFSPIYTDDSISYWTSIGELRYMLCESKGIKLAYHIGFEQVRLEYDYLKNAQPNIDLAFNGEDRQGYITTTANNPEYYTQKSTLQSLVNWFLTDWRERGLISPANETELSGLKYVLEAEEEPYYYDVQVNTETSVTGEPQSFDALADEFSAKTDVYAVQVIREYAPGEAVDIYGHDFHTSSTLYRVRAYYDLVNDKAVDFEFNVVHGGSRERQFEGCPGFGAGRKYVMCFKNGVDANQMNVAVSELEFEIYTIDGIDLAYHICGDNIRLKGAYMNIDLEMAESEKSVVTTTSNNPVRYTQKSTVGALSEFFRTEFWKRGYLKNYGGISPLVITLENENGMGFESYSVDSIDKITDGNPWQKLDIKEGSTLPVFTRRMRRIIEDQGMIRGYDLDYMREQLRYYARGLGFDMNELIIEDDAMSAAAISQVREHEGKFGNTLPGDYGMAEKVWCEQNGIEISVDVYGLRYRVIINFKNGYGLPDGANIGYYHDGTYEEAKKAADWLLERYEWLIGNNDAATAEVVASDNYYVAFYHSLINGDFVPYENEDGTLTEYVIPAANIETTFLNYNFDRVEFRDSRIWIFDRNASYQRIGDYPIITPEQALERIDAGKFLTTAPDVSKKSQDVEKIDLVYRSDGIPYYRCFVEISGYFENRDGKLYTVYYVPAVADEYIDGATMWDGSFNEP